MTDFDHIDSYWRKRRKEREEIAIHGVSKLWGASPKRTEDSDDEDDSLKMNKIKLNDNADYDKKKKRKKSKKGKKFNLN